MVLPAARAGPIFQTASSSGKFHGTMAAHTPIGSRRTMPLANVGILSRGPGRSKSYPRASSAKYCRRAIEKPRWNAPAWRNGVPFSSGPEARWDPADPRDPGNRARYGFVPSACDLRHYGAVIGGQTGWQPEVPPFSWARGTTADQACGRLAAVMAGSSLSPHSPE